MLLSLSLDIFAVRNTGYELTIDITPLVKTTKQQLTPGHFPSQFLKFGPV